MVIFAEWPSFSANMVIFASSNFEGFSPFGAQRPPYNKELLQRPYVHVSLSSSHGLNQPPELPWGFRRDRDARWLVVDLFGYADGGGGA